jgi:hypothetical protein
MFIIIFFLSYKYLYLEQTLFMLSNKLNKIEIEYNNPSVYSPSTVKMNTAEIIMNEIFNECTDNGCCPINKHPYDDDHNNDNNNDDNDNDNDNDNDDNNNDNKNDNNNNVINITTTVNKTKNNNNKTTQIIDEIEIVNEIFDLKKDISTDDKESVISASVNGGHAAKKALMKLSLDKLKAKCEENDISTEGTKNQLADRIIVHDNSITIE